jgi:integrase
MPSLYERNGNYYADYYDSSRSPSRKRFSLRTSDREEAKARLEEAERLRETGALDPWGDDPYDALRESEPTLGALLDRFCEHKRQTGRAETTIQKYRDVWSRLFDEVGRDMPISEFTAGDVRRFCYDPDVKTVTGETRYRQLRVLLRWSEHAEETIAHVEKPSPGPRRPKAIREEELKLLCETICDDYREKRRKGHCRPREIIWLIPTFRFAYYTGLRRSELSRLRWPDVRLGQEIVIVREQKQGGEDTVPLIAPAKEIVEKMGPKPNRAYVFGSPDSPEFDRSLDRMNDTLSRQFGAYRKMAGIREEITLHSLRHGFATRLAQNGASAFAIKNAMRHSDVQTSQVYVHMVNDRLANEMEDAFS